MIFGITLQRLESRTDKQPRPLYTALREFHIKRSVREEYGLESSLFALRGNVLFADFHSVREFTQKLNARVNPLIHPEKYIKAGQLNAMGLIDEILHYAAGLYRQEKEPDALHGALLAIEKKIGKEETALLLKTFTKLYPPQSVQDGKTSETEYLSGKENGESREILVLEELMLLALANANPAFSPYSFMFDDTELKKTTQYEKALVSMQEYLKTLAPFGPDNQSLWDLLHSPAEAEPYSLSGQLDYIRRKWGLFIGKYLMRLLTSLDVVKEEEKPIFFGPGPTKAYVYGELEHEYERFSMDREWMPRTVLIAKSTLVWLDQLSKKYGTSITRLDQIPDLELDELSRRGFTGLWLIGLWERSQASRKIKQRCGNPEAAASAYSLYDYDIAWELGGWEALETLRERCSWRGIRLGSDMVPNHTGIDSRWIMEHPDRFLQLDRPPFPAYSFNGENLSDREGIGIYLEDHYYDRSDAAVVFKRVDFSSGDTRYIYHGNDGTSMPWNDTAQIDFLNEEAREAVIATIIGVCQQFPIVRFDAAMTLAKKHIQRLWYPEPGQGGDIASRAEHSIPREEFDRRIPKEFWRDLVDRCAQEAPDTLLLAEAFWMMEGYFVRTLGMHRVYNSAFMNMLKNEENAKYRASIKNTLEFEPQILQRFVNFMNNPDEETAVAQFGKGDKYFGLCTLMVSMPGLPMFGHGQIEGFEEKYGMEYRKAYRDEQIDSELVQRHEREIFPLLKKRRLFAGSTNFALFDVYTADGSVNENIFAYSNRLGDERALIVYNNSYQRAAGWVHTSVPAQTKDESGNKRILRRSLNEALDLPYTHNSYVIMREQRSELWFIRPLEEFCKQGLFISLNGYQAQVFLDLHTVEDTAHGRWRRLCNELGGRGTPDLNTAFQDIFLKDLYIAFNELAKASFFNQIHEFFVSGQKNIRDTGKKPGIPKAAPFIEALREPTLRFIKVASEYLYGSSGEYESFTPEKSYPESRAETTWEEFALIVQRLIRIAELPAKPPATLHEKGRTFIQKIAERLRSEPESCAYVAAYTLLSLSRGIIGTGVSGMDGRKLVDHWCLDRKIREAYLEVGYESEDLYRISELLKLILSRTAPATESPYISSSLSKALVLEAAQSRDIRSYLEVNVFNDIVWFKKERFEELVFYASVISIIESDSAFVSIHSKKGQDLQEKERIIHKAPPHPSKINTPKWMRRIETIGSIYEEVNNALNKSDYQLEGLLKALEKGLRGKN